MSLTTLVVKTGALVQTGLDVPDLKADFNTGPAQAGLTLANQILALGTIAGVVAFIVVGALLMFGGLGAHNKSKAWIALGIAGAGAMFMGSISAAMTFFGNIPLF
ncbi:hypothetical protein [Leucobacter musarum]|uniref:hypothetical protein n=1 Tax=Leucobacter musarum TaxID=1930747 RepID=UPI0006A75F4D|nr:hypothetical protein [Leucobacter musarum]